MIKEINAAVLAIFSKISFSSFSLRFINARRRIVQPMIDQSNRTGKFKEKEVLFFYFDSFIIIAITQKGSLKCNEYKHDMHDFSILMLKHI